ncbi:MAG: hypothetical protein GWN01_09310 [Nitrosopumilaceae archaeon]|nr:hypothetical protein [Nitrosopumilaceae archaeon]NIU87807.1 hypothetical protein [Nitrosopumilaceae archaeon]NIV65189.1 hypothetical protein [Nitrosopumilaceae archaeon]NIX61705.1 hypothetical protein [Nitrosopumilaceae archaeon]
MDKKKLLQLKDRLDKLENEMAVEKGSLRQLFERLNDHGYDSLEQAQKALQELQKQEQELQQELNEKLDEIEHEIEAWED